MLQLLNISNIALIDSLRVEFEAGLNLLTGETGSGKSIIVDALSVLIGGRFTSDLLKSGRESAFIEGLFLVNPRPQLEALFDNAGILLRNEENETKAVTRPRTPKGNLFQLIIRRELSSTGRNKIFINNQLATQSFLRDLRQFLVDIHGQGDLQTLFDEETHLRLLDAFAGNEGLREEVSESFRRWRELKGELDVLVRDEAERFQLVDTLKFQINELECAHLSPGEDERLQEERRRLVNVEKLKSLCQSSYLRIYEDDEAALARVRQTANELVELAEYESSFRDYVEGLESARAVLEDLAFSLRDFADRLEFSPERLAAIEDRLAELSRLKRKYGGSLDTALAHLARSHDRLRQIERSDERESELNKDLNAAWARYLERAQLLHTERVRAARKFEQAVEREIAEVALDNARFQVRIASEQLQSLDGDGEKTQGAGEPRDLLKEAAGHKPRFAGPSGFDRVEFYFSANVGEDLKPLARIASGGEASRLMLVLKTVANASEFPRTIVFDEIDTGIGGRVSAAVGAKLKKLAQTNQVLCVTHQPQIACFADSHLLVQKEAVKRRTELRILKLDRLGRVEELARMLTGADITDTARRHARELLKV